MKLYKEFDLNEFEAWSGATDTKEIIIKNNKVDTFNMLVDDIFPNGTDETGMNDFLWFDNEFIFETLGISAE